MSLVEKKTVTMAHTPPDRGFRGTLRGISGRLSAWTRQGEDATEEPTVRVAEGAQIQIQIQIHTRLDLPTLLCQPMTTMKTTMTELSKMLTIPPPQLRPLHQRKAMMVMLCTALFVQ